MYIPFTPGESSWRKLTGATIGLAERLVEMQEFLAETGIEPKSETNAKKEPHQLEEANNRWLQPTGV